MKLQTTKMLAKIEDGIGWMTFNNPERRNAVSWEMWEGVRDIMTAFQADDSVRVAIMAGAGDKAFVSGADISEFAEKRNSAAAQEEYGRVSAEAHRALAKFDKPLIAKINGFCIGGGMAVALSADIRIASTPSQFAIPAARLGLGYGYDGLKTLSDLVGPAMAKEILFTARKLSSEEALRIGLINRLVATEELDAVALEYAQMIAQNAPLTIRTAKAAIDEAYREPAKRDLAAIENMVKGCFDSKDYNEGRTAFMEKRKPNFIGA